MTRLTWSAALRMIRWPTAVEPVKQTLRTSGWVTNRSPTTEPLPGSTVNTPSGMPASRASCPMSIAVSGVSSAGLSTTVLPAASAGAKPQPAIGIGKFHGTMIADDAERLLEGDVEAAGDRDLPAEEPLGCRRVVAQHVDDVAGLPPGVADRVAGVGDLERGELLVVLLDDVGEAAQQQPAVGRGSPPRQAGRRPRRRAAIAASVSSSADEVDRGDDLLGRRVDDVVA